MSRDPLILPTDHGLFCPLGGFHLDPWRPVETAVVTHAHSDHAAPGSQRYITSASGASLVAHRVASDAVEGVPFGETRRFGDALVSLHPAGHILGSAQVRIEPVGGGPVWVFTGDYARAAHPACEPFEPLTCDVLLTESTFGLPVFRWSDPAAVHAQIDAWWRANAASGRTSVLLCYSLGKSQRVLAGLDPTTGPIGVHGAVVPFIDLYRAAGVALPPVVHAGPDSAASLKGCGLIVAPPSVAGSTWARRFAGPEGVALAPVSGWMSIRGRRRWQAVDRGFVLSDHADWPGLLATVRGSGARRVGVTHGYAEPLARYLAEQGYEAFVVPTRYTGDAAEEPGERA
jgi:putative mRNA 3-end processing factor